jgi:hypothetical protein
MIIHDLDLLRPFVAPPEYDPPLIVHPDRMLACEVASQRFQAVPRRRGEIAEHRGVVQLHQLSASDVGDVGRKPLGNASALQNQRRDRAPEASGSSLQMYHGMIRHATREASLEAAAARRRAPRRAPALRADRGSAAHAGAAVAAALGERVAVKENGRSRRITELAAAAKQFANHAASGDQPVGGSGGSGAAVWGGIVIARSGVSCAKC